MTDTKKRFEGVGTVRAFTAANESPPHTATFLLEVDKMIVPCEIKTAAGTPPKIGQRVRVIG